MKRAVAAVLLGSIAVAAAWWFSANPRLAEVTFVLPETPHVVPVAEPAVQVATLAGTARQRDATTVTATTAGNQPIALTRDDTDAATRLSLDTTELSEGTHHVSLTADAAGATITLVIDRTAPAVTVELPKRHLIAGETFTVTGSSEADVTVAVGSHTTTTDVNGLFRLDIPHTSDTKQVVVTDAAGNTTRQKLAFSVIPSRVENTEIRALHVSFHAWHDPERRARIDQLLAEGTVNAVQFDIKDESGHVGHTTNVAFANDTGAALNLHDLADVVAELHARNIAVIGRIVAFADPIVARYAYDTGQRNLVIQTPSGGLYTGNYQGFTNFTDETIQNYTIDLAREAASVGVDHILWDYLRRPDGRRTAMVIPGLDGSVEDAIVAFTERADQALYPYRIQHGASLYGISADRPHEIGQDVARLSEHLDYVAPMIYPSHWGPGEYGVADPNRQPQAIVTATLNVWQRVTENRRARVVPWLEDTSYRAYDRPYHVREQHRGTYAVGIREWLMWDSASRFTPHAYDVPVPPQP